jgi:hypothetical protein
VGAGGLFSALSAKTARGVRHAYIENAWLAGSFRRIIIFRNYPINNFEFVKDYRKRMKLLAGAVTVSKNARCAKKSIIAIPSSSP